MKIKITQTTYSTKLMNGKDASAKVTPSVVIEKKVKTKIVHV